MPRPHWRRMNRIALTLIAMVLLNAPAGALAQAQNTVEISQNGRELSAEVTQELNASRAELSQSGEDNAASVRQALGEVLLRQDGEGNRANLSQRGYTAGSVVVATQQGLSNEMGLVQDGDENSAALSQLGARNRMEVVQVGDANTLSLQQSGDDLEMTITQMGGASAIIVQTGPAP
jgi:hypothetical protein